MEKGEQNPVKSNDRTEWQKSDKLCRKFEIKMANRQSILGRKCEKKTGARLELKDQVKIRASSINKELPTVMYGNNLQREGPVSRKSLMQIRNDDRKKKCGEAL